MTYTTYFLHFSHIKASYDLNVRKLYCILIKIKFENKMTDKNIEKNWRSDAKQKIKKAFSEWCKNTTTHGFSPIVRNENYLIKLMWLVCFLISGGLCLQLVVQSTMDYFSYSVNVKTEQVQDRDAYFPSISICSKFFFYLKFIFKHSVFSSYNLTRLKSIQT
jgi:hypothetical protein